MRTVYLPSGQCVLGGSIHHIYRGSPLVSTINRIKDKSFSQAIVDVLLNRLRTLDWRSERLHSEDDIFMHEKELITDTSIAELAERTLRNNQIIATLINFPQSQYYQKTSLQITKNELHNCSVNCVEEKQQIVKWFSENLNPVKQYDFESTDPPQDYHTVLKDVSKFKKTNQMNGGRAVYKEIETGRYWYVDNFHFGPSSHIEVFDSRGIHIGESNLEGSLDETKRDISKRIDV